MTKLLSHTSLELKITTNVHNLSLCRNLPQVHTHVSLGSLNQSESEDRKRLRFYHQFIKIKTHRTKWHHLSPIQGLFMATRCTLVWATPASKSLMRLNHVITLGICMINLFHLLRYYQRWVKQLPFLRESCQLTILGGNLLSNRSTAERRKKETRRARSTFIRADTVMQATTWVTTST